MTRSYLFSLCILSTPLLTAAQPSVYFLSGCPAPDSTYSFPSNLYRLDVTGERITHIREVVPKADGTVFIRPYYDDRLVSIMRGGIGERIHFSLVRMDSPETGTQFYYEHPTGMTFLQANMLDIPGKGLYQAIRISKKDELLQLGMNLDTMKQEAIPSSDYKYAVSSGSPGIGTTGGDAFVLDSYPHGGIIFGRDRVNMDFRLPAAMRAQDAAELIELRINNATQRVLLSVGTLERTRKTRAETPFQIYDKSTDEWHTAYFPGDFSKSLRAFGEWLAGAETYQREEVSPGKENRRQIRTDTGFAADSRLGIARIYCPGNLFLYNIQTKKLRRIETGQGDSEILLTDGKTVYYRINNALYSAPIEEDGIGSPKLLAREEIVRDIHWAFLGPDVE